MNTKICPRCLNKFRCESEKDCWCESYNIHKKDMVELMEKYTDCLCPDCLSKFAEN